MRGLDMPQGTGAAPEGMAPDGATPATPEQQAQFDKFVAMGMAILYDPQFIPRARAVIAGEGEAVEGIAEVAVGIVGRIFMQAKKEGEDIDPAVVLHGGWQIINYVAEVARVSANVEISPEDIEAAFYIAADKFRQTLEKNGVVEPMQDPGAGLQQARQVADETQLRGAVERAQGARRKPQVSGGVA